MESYLRMNILTTFRDLVCSAENMRFPVYATPGTIRGVREYKKLGEIPDGLFHEIDVDQKFTLGDLSVEAFCDLS